MKVIDALDYSYLEEKGDFPSGICRFFSHHSHEESQQFIDVVRNIGTLNSLPMKVPHKMANQPNNRRPVKTVETAFQILETLKNRDGARISEITSELDLAKSTIHRHLQTLVELEYVVKKGDIYYLSMRFLGYGEYVQNRQDEFDLVREKVDEIANKTDERANFVINEHGKGVYVYFSVGDNAVRTEAGLGNTIPLHSTANGKAILANLPHERVVDIIDRHGLPSITPHTIADEEKLFEELEQIQERGYAINDEENIEGLRAMAVPIMDQTGLVLGAISVAGPSHRFNGEWFNQDLPDLLLGIVNELELNLSYSK